VTRFLEMGGFLSFFCYAEELRTPAMALAVIRLSAPTVVIHNIGYRTGYGLWHLNSGTCQNASFK